MCVCVLVWFLSKQNLGVCIIIVCGSDIIHTKFSFWHLAEVATHSSFWNLSARTESSKMAYRCLQPPGSQIVIQRSGESPQCARVLQIFGGTLILTKAWLCCLWSSYGMWCWLLGTQSKSQPQKTWSNWIINSSRQFRSWEWRSRLHPDSQHLEGTTQDKVAPWESRVGSGAHDPSQLQSKFKASLGYLKPCFQSQTK